MKFQPFPIMESKNLLLRRMTFDDIEDLLEMRQDPRMIEFVDGKLDKNSDETKAYIEKMNQGIDENKSIIWAIEYKKTKKLIGTISIWDIQIKDKTGELGYGIIPNYQGQGLMKESLLMITQYAFNDLGLIALDAYTEENNIKSINLLKSCHFNEINRVVDHGYFNHRDYNMIVYRLESKNNETLG